MDSPPTGRQLKLLRSLAGELSAYRAFEAKGIARRIERLQTVKQASELIDSTMKVLREYQGD